jgi:putative FmdB family regulatory protein
MPTYEYACSSCKHEWELEQSIKESAITECPSCHAQTAKRQISRGTGFILKGSGWYSDLYSGASNKGSGSTSGSSNGSSEGSGSSSSGSSTPSSSDTSGSSSSGSSDKSTAAAAAS